MESQSPFEEMDLVVDSLIEVTVVAEQELVIQSHRKKPKSMAAED